MGLYHINAVLNGLKGRKLSVGKKKFGASEVALLATIANNQPNPGFHDDYDPICYDSPKALLEYTHLGKTKLFDARNLLLDLGLITFKQSEFRHGKKFTNVYRINLQEIRKFFPDNREWREVLRISSAEPPSKDVLRALCVSFDDADAAVRDANPEVRDADATVRNTGSRVRNTDTNRRKTEEDNKQTDARVEMSVDDRFLNEILDKMSQSIGVRRFAIGKSSVQEAIAGKNPDSVRQCVSQPSEFVRNAKNPVGAMIAALRNLPPKEEDVNNRPVTEPSQQYLALKNASREVKDRLKKIREIAGTEDCNGLEGLIAPIETCLKTEDGRKYVDWMIADYEKEGRDWQEPRHLYQSLVNVFHDAIKKNDFTLHGDEA